MRSLLVVAAFVVSACAVHGGPGSPGHSGRTVAPDASERRPSVADSIVSERSIRAHMAFLASDALNGRGSGTRDERSDNIQFARRGVVAHTVSSFALHREYHQPSDEVRHINVAHMRDAIASLVEPVRALANATERPAWHPGQAP